MRLQHFGMRLSLISTVAAAGYGSASGNSSVSLSEVCTTEYARDSLPCDAVEGITIDPSSVAVSLASNYSVSGQNMQPDATFDYCNVTFAYSHDNRSDTVLVTYWVPAPSEFQKRYLSTGGFAYDINQGASALAAGVPYGAVSGETDGGFGSFDTAFDDIFLLSNGTVNWPAVYAFGFTAHHELSGLGKAFTKNFFNMTADEKLYSYYQACSEGGREGWSQVQRFGEEWDGAVVGAPAMRYSFQQANHLYSNLVEHTLDYYPPPCELTKILDATITACDPLDGKTDGVVSRTELCKLHFNMSSIIGESYYCAASSGMGGFPKRQMGGGSTTPAQNGTVTAKGVAVAQQIIDGLHDSEGRQVYLSYQPSAEFQDAATTYNSTSGTWGLAIDGLAGEWIAKFLNLEDVSTISTLDGFTYDTLRDYMIKGYYMYNTTLQTDNADLTPFHKAGGKVLHFHGESDPSIPPASSVRYWESVRKIMYPGMSANESADALNEWYRFFLVPGGAHCAPSLEQTAPWPQTNLAVMIDWVENGITPVTLNATVLSGDDEGENGQLCAWPLRPYWTNNGTDMECQYDQASIDNWQYVFDGVNITVS